MINRSFVATVVASAALFTAGIGMGVQPADAAKKPKKPTIGNTTLTPKKLIAQGGTVEIRVKIKNNGSSINSVTATSTLAGGSPSAAATLTASGGDFYSGTVRVGSNSKTKKIKAAIHVQVNSTSGLVTKKVGAVQLEAGSNTGGNDATPPPPPNI